MSPQGPPPWRAAKSLCTCNASTLTPRVLDREVDVFGLDLLAVRPGAVWQAQCKLVCAMTWSGRGARDGPDWQEIAEILADGIAQVAPTFLIARLD
jgi:hypothetical protein